MSIERHDVCNVCPVKTDALEAGRGENMCSAMSGSIEFGSNRSNCLAVNKLRKKGVIVESLTELMNEMPRLRKKEIPGLNKEE